MTDEIEFIDINSILSMFTLKSASGEDCGIDAEIDDDLAKLYHPRHHYEGGAKTPYRLMKIGGRELRSCAFHYPSLLTEKIIKGIILH